MIVYLVRHGESMGNQRKVHQSAEEPLSEIGLDQAALVAHRFTKINFEALLASPFKRAHQTAQVIADKTGKEVESFPEFREYHRPKEIQGMPYDHPESLRVRELVVKNSHDPNWHYSTEENFHDLKKRVDQAFSLLEKRPESILTVVSHGTFISLMISVKIFGHDISSERFFDMFSSIKYSNTGISVMEYGFDDYSKRDRWKLVTLNDNAHLG